MLQTVSSTMTKYRMLRFGTRLGVAVSGGADSVFLLRTMSAMGLAAAVLHVNHRLRGEESDRDQEFVCQLAAEFGLPVFVETAPVSEGNVEQEARRRRYEFFGRVLESGAVDAVSTGHTLDDQAETVLSRFLRGSGTAGLAGIRPVMDSRIIRPLLELSREEIRRSLAQQGIVWREDRTNEDTSFLRNRIRLQVLPALESVCGPALPRILANTAEWAGAEEEYWRLEVARLESAFLRKSDRAVLLNVDDIGPLPVAAQRRLLRRAMEIVRGNLRSVDFAHIEAVRDLTVSAESSGRLQIPEVDVLRSFAQVRFSPIGYDSRLPRNFETPVIIPGRITLPERRITMSLEPVTGEAVYNNQVNALDRDLCAGNLRLRNWRPGDLFCRQGQSGLEKIKSLFQEFRIPLWDRRNWPVITVQHPDIEGDPIETIVWARQFGVAAGYAASTQSKNVVLVRETAAEPFSPDSQVTESKRIFPASMEVKRAPGPGSRTPGEPGAEVL